MFAESVDPRKRSLNPRETTARRIREPQFWVVSQSVSAKSQKMAEKWAEAIRDCEAAFMGWGPDDGQHRIGPTFANNIRRGDVILVARRHRSQPDVVGFGVVTSDAKKAANAKKLGIKIPDEKWNGSFRNLSPFIPWRGDLPRGIMSALTQTRALRKLNPAKPEHQQICNWMVSHLSKRVYRRPDEPTAKAHQTKVSIAEIGELPQDHQFEFDVRTRAAVIRAKKQEARLVKAYGRWLLKKGRHLGCLTFNQIKCDAYEEDRRNLLEAKCKAKREHIRMAVGQLLDYAYLARKSYRNLNLAILLPEKPNNEMIRWLATLRIKLVWREGQKFRDNANEWFC